MPDRNPSGLRLHANTLRVASIVGRLFRAKWLTGYYPELGAFPTVKASLDALESLDITPLDSPEPELAYLFKHIVTHEVTYESLPFATRARLHEQLAVFLESQVGAEHAPPLLETLAFHYGRSENKAKQMEYLRKAGEAAQKNFANDAALDYYGKLLPLLEDDKEKIKIHLKRGEVYEFIGKFDEAESDYHAALELAKESVALKAGAQFALGKLNRLRGEFAPALDWLAQAKGARMALEDNAGLAQVLIETGIVLWRKSEFAQAREPLNAGLALAQETGDKLGATLALNHLGNVATCQGDYIAARALHEENLSLRREMGDKAGIAASLTNLGVVTFDQGDYAAARALHEESLALFREMGHKFGISNSLINLGLVAFTQGDYTAAQDLYEDSLVLNREMGNKKGIATGLLYLGRVTYAQGEYTTARALQEESLSLHREIGDKSGMVESLNNLGFLAVHAQGGDATARASFAEALALCKEMDEKSFIADALLGLGLVDVDEDQPEARENILHSLRLRQETGGQLYQTSCLIGVAGLALHEGNPQFAAQLLGAVESALKALDVLMEFELLPFHAQTLAKVRVALGESAFQSAWEEGSQWSLEEAVNVALEE